MEREMSNKHRGIVVIVLALLLLGAAAVFIVIGVIRGEAAAVLQKAAVICMECIGLG